MWWYTIVHSIGKRRRQVSGAIPYHVKLLLVLFLATLLRTLGSGSNFFFSRRHFHSRTPACRKCTKCSVENQIERVSNMVCPRLCLLIRLAVLDFGCCTYNAISLSSFQFCPKALKQQYGYPFLGVLKFCVLSWAVWIDCLKYPPRVTSVL